MTETAEPTIGIPEDAVADPAFHESLKRIYKDVEEAGGLIPDPGVDFGPPRDESDTFFIGREFTLEEFRRWFAVQRLGSRPYNAIGYHHTETNPREWAGMESLNFIFFEWYAKKLKWPRGVGPQIWVYSGEFGYSPGVPRIYVGTHPAYDGIGINFRNGRWLHIEHIWNGDHAPFSETMKRVSGEVLAIVCARHKHADREIPIKFVRDGGVNNPDRPHGIMYHRDENPNWNPNDPNNSWPKTCPGLLVSHDNLDADLVRFAKGSSSGEIRVTAEAGVVVAATGAVARDAPRRNAGGNQRQLEEGKKYETTGFTDDGESVESTSRWYRLNNRKWVHASGGTYKKLPGGVRGFKADERRLTVGIRHASVRPGPSRESGEPTLILEPGTTHKVDGFTDKGQELDGVSRWYRLDGNAGWVHASGWVLD